MERQISEKTKQDLNSLIDLKEAIITGHEFYSSHIDTNSSMEIVQKPLTQEKIVLTSSESQQQLTQEQCKHMNTQAKVLRSPTFKPTFLQLTGKTVMNDTSVESTRESPNMPRLDQAEGPESGDEMFSDQQKGATMFRFPVAPGDSSQDQGSYLAANALQSGKDQPTVCKPQFPMLADNTGIFDPFLNQLTKSRKHSYKNDINNGKVWLETSDTQNFFIEPQRQSNHDFSMSFQYSRDYPKLISPNLLRNVSPRGLNSKNTESFCNISEFRNKEIHDKEQEVDLKGKINQTFEAKFITDENTKKLYSSVVTPVNTDIQYIIRENNIEDCGVVMERIYAMNIDNYATAISQMIGERTISHIGHDPNNSDRIIAFIKTTHLAQQLIDKGIWLKGRWLRITSMKEPVTKCIVSNIFPFISDSLVIAACNSFAKTVYPNLRPIPAGTRSPSNRGILSFRREMFLIVKEDHIIPETIIVKHNNKEYTLSISTEGPLCYICHVKGHSASQCTEKKVVDWTQQQKPFNRQTEQVRQNSHQNFVDHARSIMPSSSLSTSKKSNQNNQEIAKSYISTISLPSLLTFNKTTTEAQTEEVTKDWWNYAEDDTEIIEENKNIKISETQNKLKDKRNVMKYRSAPYSISLTNEINEEQGTKEIQGQENGQKENVDITRIRVEKVDNKIVKEVDTTNSSVPGLWEDIEENDVSILIQNNEEEKEKNDEVKFLEETDIIVEDTLIQVNEESHKEKELSGTKESKISNEDKSMNMNNEQGKVIQKLIIETEGKTSDISKVLIIQSNIEDGQNQEDNLEMKKEEFTEMTKDRDSIEILESLLLQVKDLKITQRRIIIKKYLQQYPTLPNIVNTVFESLEFPPIKKGSAKQKKIAEIMEDIRVITMPPRIRRMTKKSE